MNMDSKHTGQAALAEQAGMSGQSGRPDLAGQADLPKQAELRRQAEPAGRIEAAAGAAAPDATLTPEERFRQALVSPAEALSLLEREPDGVVFIDIRETGEFAAARLSGPVADAVRLAPLSVLSHLSPAGERQKTAVFFCRSGKRTEANFARLEKLGYAKNLVLDKGLNGWQKAGLPVQAATRVFSLERQTQIGVGLLVLAFSLLGLRFSWGGWLACLVGAGLVSAGFTGFCSLRLFLSAMPWNRKNL